MFELKVGTTRQTGFFLSVYMSDVRLQRVEILLRWPGGIGRLRFAAADWNVDGMGIELKSRCVRIVGLWMLVILVVLMMVYMRHSAN